MASAWGDAWGDAWGNAWGERTVEAPEVVGPSAWDLRVEETQNRLNNAIRDEQDILDLTAMSMLTNWHK